MFLLLFTHGVLACQHKTEFSKCLNFERKALVTSSSCDAPSSQIVEGLTCSFSCPPGSYLSVDPKLKIQKCFECEAGSYSIGGGIQINSWNIQRHPIVSFCWVLEAHGWEFDKKCTGWHSSEDEYLVSGRSSVHNWYETAMIFYPVIVKQGSLRVTYRKETNTFIGQDPGEFMIFVDDVLRHVDLSTHKLNWLDISIELTPGAHEIEMIFSSFVTEHVNEIQIKEIQIRGTELASLQCEACPVGSNDPGSDTCKTCGVGSYLSGNKCEVCPAGTSSLEGSVGVESCLKLLKCGEKDYHFTFSDCEDGFKSKIFEWNFPLMCDSEEVSLPESEKIDCSSCPEGQIYLDQKCQYCPSGHFLDSSVCKACSAGTFAGKKSVYLVWDSLPKGFWTGCKSGNQLDCGYGWEPRGSFITTSQFLQEGWSADLQTNLKIVQNKGKVFFRVTVEGQNSLLVFVDGHLRITIKKTQEKDFEIDLNPGNHHVKWSCNVFSKNHESCSIFTLKVEGSQDGGAVECSPCPEGFYSSEAADLCRPCPAGLTSNLNKTECVPCQGNTFSVSGGSCENCLSQTVSDVGHTYCFIPSNFTLNSQLFLMKKLVGVNDQQSEYCDESKMELYCFQSFFGPVQAHDDFFYVSVGKPSKPDLPSFASISQGFSYAFAILDKNDEMISKEFLAISQNKSCEFDYSKVVVNLGSRIKSLESSFSGFRVSYGSGDICMENSTFGAQIDFICNKRELEGWPIFLSRSGCVYNFVWPTIHACPVCDSSEVTYKSSACENDLKTIHAIANKSCIFSDSHHYKTEKQKCKSGSFYTSAMFISSLIISMLMLIMIILMCYLTFRTKQRYQRLDLLTDPDPLPCEDCSPQTPENIIKAFHLKFPSFSGFPSPPKT